MKRALTTALVFGLLAIGSATGPAHAAGGLAGVGEVGSHCEPSMVISVAGAETVPGTWAFDVAWLNPENTINDPITFCDFVPALTIAFAGEWNPATGGCMPVVGLDVVLGEQNLCLTSPAPIDDMTTRYSFNVCDRPIAECQETEDTVSLVGATV